MLRPIDKLVIAPGAKAARWGVGKVEAPRLVGVPGLAFGKSVEEFKVGRSHLPLVDSSDAIKLRAGLKLSGDAAIRWDGRDKLTQEKGFTLRGNQQSGIDFVLPRRGVLIGDDMRAGKGSPRGTLVLTPTGWVTIESLRVGDRVIGSNGKPCSITGVFDRGTLPVFRVGFSDGSSVRVDGEHLWATWNHNGWHRRRPPVVKATRELADDLTYGNHGNLKWRIPLVSPIEFDLRPVEIDPYLLGVLLGDGSLTQKTITFVPGDDLVPEEVAKVIPCGVELREYRGDRSASTWRLSRTDASRPNPVRLGLMRLGLMGLSSEKKFVPLSYLFNSFACRLSLLQGLMDTDGELYSNSRKSADYIGFSSSSRALVQAVKFLVMSMGGTAREQSVKKEPKYTYRGETRIGLPSYRLSISMPRGISPFRARPGYQDRPKYQPARLIESIEPAGEEPVICLSVDASDQLYVTEDFIVTHNTLTSIMSHDPATGQLVIIGPLMGRAMWLSWLRRVFPGLEIGVLIGRTFDSSLLTKPIVFGHYDIIHAWQSLNPRIGTLVFDEAHALANPESLRSQAARILAFKAARVIAMTGTPIWNLPAGLFNVLDLVLPGEWGNHRDFANRYGAPEPTAWGPKYTGISNEAELTERLSEVMIRRRWADITDDAPTISRSVVIADIDEAGKRKLDIQAGELKSAGRGSTGGHWSSYRRIVSKYKIPTTVTETKKILSRGEPVVVWAYHVETATEISERLEGSYLITGDVPPKVRDLRIDTWRADPCGALVATMSVAREAIDLSHGKFAVYGEVCEMPPVIAQSEMRTFDPKRPMFVTFVVANHFVDHRLVQILEKKLSASAAVGVGTATEAINALRGEIFGEVDQGDMGRFIDDLLAGCDDD